MKYYKVSYYCGNGIWSANIAVAETEEKVNEYYAKKSDKVIVSDASDSDLNEARRKGKPIVTIK